MSETEIRALITLIDDPDEGVYSQIRERIVSLGDPVVPVLEQAWEVDDLGDLFRNRIEDILHTIHLEGVTERLKAWKETGGDDLLEGALIISRYRYPDMDEQKVKARLASIRQDIWLELNDHLDRLREGPCLQPHLLPGTRLQREQAQLPRAAELVHQRGIGQPKGQPALLGDHLSGACRGSGLPLRGVNLPNHFVLAYLDEDSIGGADSGQEGEENVLVLRERLQPRGHLGAQ